MTACGRKVRAEQVFPTAATPFRPPSCFEIFQTTLLSTGVVAAAEIGDKTMLLAVFLAARFRKPWTIILGIFVATFLNHVIAGALCYARELYQCRLAALDSDCFLHCHGHLDSYSGQDR